MEAMRHRATSTEWQAVSDTACVPSTLLLASAQRDLVVPTLRSVRKGWQQERGSSVGATLHAHACLPQR